MPLCIGDVSANAAQIERIANSCAPDTQLIVFPELSICGYTCGDLFFESLLLDACEKALQTLCTSIRENLICVVGVPLRQNGRLYNCAAVIFNHEIIGIQVKSYLPNYNEILRKALVLRQFRTERGDDRAERKDDPVHLQAADPGRYQRRSDRHRCVRGPLGADPAQLPACPLRRQCHRQSLRIQ